MITVKAKHVAAALLFQAHKDVRYFLNGLYLEPLEDGTVQITATDGHKLATLNGGEWTEPRARIVRLSRDAASAISKKGARDYAAVFSADTVELRNGAALVGVWPIEEIADAKYPDWRWIAKVQERDGATAALAPDHLAAFTKAALILDPSIGSALEIRMAGTSAAPIHIPGAPEFFGVLMPIRSHECEAPAFLSVAPAAPAAAA